MHVVFCEFVAHHGGASRAIVDLAARLAEHTQVSIVDPYGCCDEFREAVGRTAVGYHVLDPDAGSVIVGGKGQRLKRLYRIARSVPGLLRLRRRARRLFREIVPTVISSSNPKSLMLAAAAGASTPLVGYMHGWYRPDMIPGYARRLYKRRCAALFAVSLPTAFALRCAGIDHRKIVVLHNTVDVERLRERANQDLESELPQLNRPVRLLLPAGLMKTKGQHTAVTALRTLVEQDCDAVLWLAGDVAVGGQESYVADTQKLAEDHGVADRVEWLGLRGDIPQVMQASTTVILPSHTEGFGLVIAEAMALGRPVAATPVGGVLDLILPGVTGLLFDVEDDRGLAECILHYANDADNGDRIAQRALEYIRTSPRFNPQRQARKALDVFCQLSEHGRLRDHEVDT